MKQEVEFWRRKMFCGEDVYLTFSGDRCVVSMDGKVHEILVKKDHLIDERCDKLDCAPKTLKVGYFNDLPYLRLKF